MTLAVTYPLNTTFAGVNSLQAQGTIGSGNSLPTGIGSALTIENGRMKSVIRDTDTVTAGSVRSEITTGPAANGVYVYKFKFELAADFAPLFDPLILMQIHDTPDGGDGAKAVPFALYYTQGGDLAIYVPAQTLPTEGATSRIINLGRAERGREYSAALHVLWSTTNTGFRHFYLDGRAVFKEEGLPTTYVDVTGNYFKCGLYDATGNDRFGSATAYYRDVEVWSAPESLGAVMGTPPFPRVKLTEL